MHNEITQRKQARGPTRFSRSQGRTSLKRTGFLCSAIWAVVMTVYGGGKGVTAEQWQKAGHNKTWRVISRESLITELQANIRKGMDTSDVREYLGAPESEWEDAENKVWTYGIHNLKFFQVFFDRKGSVTEFAQKHYISMYDIRKKEAEGEVLLLNPKDRMADIGVWRIGTVRADGDRRDVGRRAFRYVPIGMAAGEVSRIFGRPDSDIKGIKTTVWAYRLGPSDFVLMAKSPEDQVLAIQERSYRDETGDSTAKVMDGSLDILDDKTCHIAAWNATFPRYTIMDNRRGIGKKMKAYLNLGMTRQEVLDLMGEPTENKMDGTYYSYILHSDSVITLKFNNQGILSSVRHDGT